ncbi:hypothetical protein Tco_1343732 [Tanacetum coccineum]
MEGHDTCREIRKAKLKVSNLKKYLSDETLIIPLAEIQVDDKPHFIEEPMEIMDSEIKYVDMKPNRELLKKSIYEGPYIMIKITHLDTPEDGDNPRIPSHTEKETYQNASLENRKLIDTKAEAVRMILNGIGNDIYSIVDACRNAKEMWIAIEHLQQG